ncbi:MAG: ATP-binding protein [Burkholderiales bacterium]|nr:ATP-binding protein [Burkholderiales bacterium]
MLLAVLRLLVGGWLVSAALASAAGPSQPEPLRVLLVNSFTGASTPYDTFASLFRAELAPKMKTPVAFYEVSMDGSRFDPARDTDVYVRFLAERFAGRPPDLIVAVGPPAARFYAMNRGRLFGDTSVLFAAAEERSLRGIPRGPNDIEAGIRLRLPALFEHILAVLPETTTIAVVIGSSPIERFWADAVKRETQPIAGRVRIELLNELTFDAVLERVAALPPRSAVLFTQVYVDAAGTSLNQAYALKRLVEVANAPLFGLYESQLGQGIVGGPLMSESEAGKRMAKAAAIVFAGEASAGLAVEPIELGAPAYDWAALQRWNIDRRRLPPDSRVLFQPPSPWDEYRRAIVAGGTALLVLAAMVVLLLLQRSRRRRAEAEALSLSGRILTAHEDERRRLARELHDDLTPRLARLAIDAAAAGAAEPTARAMHDELVRVSEDVHALSYRLHPTVLDDLGLVDALRAECDRIANGQGLDIACVAEQAAAKVPSDVALCLYRIAQEALRNAVRHASAQAVRVTLAQRHGVLRLAVADDGVGFDPDAPRERPGLGLASMRERIRQIGGELRIRSAAGAGTTVTATVRLQGQAA